MLISKKSISGDFAGVSSFISSSPFGKIVTEAVGNICFITSSKTSQSSKSSSASQMFLKIVPVASHIEELDPIKGK
jgi:hypothetical protein